MLGNIDVGIQLRLSCIAVGKNNCLMSGIICHRDYHNADFGKPSPNSVSPCYMSKRAYSPTFSRAATELSYGFMWASFLTEVLRDLGILK